MVRKKFKLPNDPTIYNVNVESEKGKEWLSRNTNAQLIEEEEEEVIEQGNQEDPAPSATAGSETAAQDQEAGQPQNNQQQDTESASESTSSVLPEAYKNLEVLQSQLAESKKGLEEFDYEAQLRDTKASIDSARIMGDQDAYERSVNKYNNILSEYKDKVNSHNAAMESYNELLTQYKTEQDKLTKAEKEKLPEDVEKTPGRVAMDMYRFLRAPINYMAGTALEGALGEVFGDPDPEDSAEQDTWIEQAFGKNYMTNAISDVLWRAPFAGVAVGRSAGDSYTFFDKGANMTEEEMQDFIEAARRVEEQGGQTDEMIAASRLMQVYKEKGYNGFNSWLMAYAQNPTVLLQYTTQSLAQMVLSAVDSPEIMELALKNATKVAAATGAVGAAAGSVIPGAGTAAGFTAGWNLGGVSGFMGGVSEAMETGLTTVQLMQEAAEEEGLDWANMSDDERVSFMRELASDEERFGDIKSKALARGKTIGGIDTITGIVTMGVGKGLTKALPVSQLSARTIGITTAATAVTETAGGLASEYYGQKAGGQEFNLEEILIEGFADKTFTGIQIAKGLKSGGNPKYTLNGEELNGKQFHDALKLMDDAAFMGAKIKIENSPAVAKLVSNRQNNIAIDQQIDSKVSDVNDRAKLIKLEKERLRLKKAKNETKSGQKALKAVEEKIDNIMAKYENAKADVTIENRKKAVALAWDSRIEADFNKNLKFAKKEASRIGKTLKVVKDFVLGKDGKYTSKQMQKFVDTYNKANPDSPMTIDEAMESDGFFLPDGTIVINEAVAKQSGQINVGAHELLHGVIQKQFQALRKAGNESKFIKSFRRALTKEQESYILKKIRERKALGENIDENTTEEWLTIFSDGLTKNELSFNEGAFDKIMNWLHKVFGDNTVYNFNKKFGSGREAYNFMKDYQASIDKNKLSDKIVKTAETGVKDKSGKVMRSMSEPMSEDEKAEVEKQVNDLGNMGWDQDTWDSHGADLAIDEIQRNKLLDRIIASKMKAGLARDVAEHPDFIKKVYAELVQHIKNFNKDKWGTPDENNSLFGWIVPYIGKKATAVYNREYKDKTLTRATPLGEKTSEGDFTTDIADDIDPNMEAIDEMGLTDEEVEQRSKFRQELELNDKLISKVVNAVIKVFGTNLPNINSDKFKKALTKAFKTDLKKPMQDLMGKGKAYDVFLEKFMPVIYKHLPVEVLVRMERLVESKKLLEKFPNAKRIFTKSYRETSVEKVDELIAKGILPKDVNRTSGPQVHTKLPYPGTDKILAFFRGKNMLELLGYEIGGSTLGTRKDALSENTITEVAFDAISTVLKDAANIQLSKDETLASKIEGLNIAGIDNIENDLVTIAKQIDRDPTVKFSFSGGSKKPSGYTGTAFRNDASTLIADIKNYGYEHVIEEVEDRETGEVKGKLVEGYKDLKIPQFTVDAVVNWNTTGNIDNSTSIGFKVAIKRLKNKFPKYSDIIEQYGKVGNLRHATNDLNQLSKDAGVIANELGGAVMNAIGWEILGYKNRIMDPAKEKKDGGKGEFYDRLESSKKDVKGEEGISLPEGLILDDVNIMNIGAPGSLFKEIAKILNKDISKQEKLDLLAKLQPRIDAANKANILLAKHIAKTIIKLAWQGKISPISALHLFQSQTSIVNGFRGLSRLDLIDVRDGSQAVSENHPSFNDAVKYYKKKGLSDADAKVEALKKLGFKGEHLGPNANTMVDIASLIFNPEANIDRALDKAFRGHSQMLTSKFITDIIDDEGGRTNDTDFHRVKFLKQSDIDNMVSAGNQSYMEVLANHEIGILLEDLFINEEAIENRKLIEKAETNKVKFSKSGKAKGMSTFDFDETLIIGGKNFVVGTDPKTGKKVKIMSHDWPIKGPALAAQGYKFDFSDFANVRGGKEGPLLQKMKNQIKKYGAENVFVLTARQQASAVPIQQWLKSQGINLPLRNITGLGKSEGSAKAQWMLQKFAEGYNDMYFVDDALPNVEAVKKVLDNLDIKSKVVQAKVKFSNSASQDFNNMLERSKGVDAGTKISSIDAKLRGAKRDRFKIRFFVPPSAEDLKGLVYAFLGKGKQGDQDLQWFKDNLFTPFAKGIRDLNSLRQRMSDEYSALKKKLPEVIKSLNNKVADTDFTIDNAIRVYLWDQAGFDVPGLSDAQKKLLIDTVAIDPKLVAFAKMLSNITRLDEGYVKPNDYWIAQNIGSDLHTVAETINREKFLTEWKENADLIFSEENLNKIEAIYGTNFREALEDMLYRMRTGSNRPTGRTSVENKFLNWINGAVGAVMFLNMRSAALQGLSMVNFLNFEDNNLFKAAKAFANQKQFWEDFKFLLNSDMLKQRRAGLKIDVSASELADAFAQGRNKIEAVIKYLLEKGFLPTKMMDSFAIAIGGSTYYRNRVNRHIKEGMSKSQAEEQAFLDFQEIAEETQQSSRPDLISMQQASSLGRLILAWANTPMQYTRLTKKALSDLINRRGDTKANVSRILYYGAVQNIIFGTLQTGLAFLMFGDEEDDKDREKKETRVLNGMLDTLLRGVGVYGALVSAAKNTLMAAHEELGKGYGKKDYSKIYQQLVNLSPPIGSKLRKIIGAIKTYDFNKDIFSQMGYGINNPAWNMIASVIEGATNAPVARIQNKLVNVREAFVGDHEMWQRVALVMGWNKWDVGVRDAEIDEARKQVKDQKKEDKKKVDSKRYKCGATTSSGGKCKMEVDKKGSKCVHHRPFKDGSDNDGDGLKEYQCKATTSSGRRCRNKTENKNKKCYAHQ